VRRWEGGARDLMLKHTLGVEGEALFVADLDEGFLSP